MNYVHLAKLITDQKINLIFSVIGMYENARKWNKKNIDNYVEIYIKSDYSNFKLKNAKSSGANIFPSRNLPISSSANLFRLASMSPERLIRSF